MDEDLVEGLRQRKPAVVKQFIQTYQGILYPLLVRFVSSPHDAEDLLQETYLKVIQNIHRYQDQGKFKSWICCLAANLAKDHLRKQKRNQESYYSLDNFNIVGGEANPLSLCESRENHELITAAISQLSPEQREVFLLREEAGLSFKEIAEQLNIPINTALGRMRYAIQKLEKSLKRKLNCV